MRPATISRGDSFFVTAILIALLLGFASVAVVEIKGAIFGIDTTDFWSLLMATGKR
jgi:hypothetical protein